MSTFARQFAEPVYLNDYGYGLSAEAYPTPEEAAAEFARWLDAPCDASRLIRDNVRFQFPSEGIGEPGVPWWECGAGGRGSKAIWVMVT